MFIPGCNGLTAEIARGNKVMMRGWKPRKAGVMEMQEWTLREEPGMFHPLLQWINC